MVSKILALCDSEEDYLLRMSGFLEKKKIQPFVVKTFTEERKLQKFAEQNKIELLLIAEKMYRGGKGTYPAAHTFILNESGNKAGENIENINKYQSSENILRAVMDSYISGGAKVPPRIGTGSRMKIIGNYTPVGRCLQTTFALSMGQILARKHKTLYLNFESYSGLGLLLEKEFSADITDVMYYFQCEKEKLSYRLSGIVQPLNGLDYIPPVLRYSQLAEIAGEQWLQLFREIERATDYEYLILDLSEQMQGLFDVLRECFRVFTIVREDGIAEAKVRQYEAILREEDYKDIAVKTKKWSLPVFRRLPAGLDQLTHGELAAYVKKIVEEDIYGYEG